MKQWWWLCLGYFVLNLCSIEVVAEVVTLDMGNNKWIDNPVSSENDDNAEQHLSIRELFKQSSNFECITKNNCKQAKRDSKKATNEAGFNVPNKSEMEIDTSIKMSGRNSGIGPNWQPIHLILGRRNPYQVGYVEEVDVGGGLQLKIKTLSVSPPIFEIEDFLTKEETDLVIEMATSKGMQRVAYSPPEVLLPEKLSLDTFDQWDTDFDGKLSINELNGLTEFNPLLLSEKDIKKIIDEAFIDLDGDGALSFGELNETGLGSLITELKEKMVSRGRQKFSNVTRAWLWHDEDELLMYEGMFENFHEKLAKVTKVPVDILKESEPMEVTEYKQNASVPCRHDSEVRDDFSNKKCCVYGAKDCRMCRYGSVHFFLNDVEKGGELLFPFADNSSFSWGDMKEDTIRKCEEQPDAKFANIAVTPKRGKAVFWYNHAVSPNTGWMSQMDPMSFVSGGQVDSGISWAARMWVDVIGDGVQHLKPWRSGSNWLRGANKKATIIEEMRNDYYREGEHYIHYERDNYRQDYRDNEILVGNVSENLTVDSDNATASIDHATAGIDNTTVDSNNTNKTDNSIKDLEVNKRSVVKTDMSSVQNDISKKETGGNYENKTKSKRYSLKQKNEQGKGNEKAEENDEKYISMIDEFGNKIDIKTKSADISNKPTPPPEKVSLVEDILDVPFKDTAGKSNEQNLPLGPPIQAGPLKSSDKLVKDVENRLLKAALLLMEELEREELEVIARNLHDRLQLACIPLLVNPIRQN